VRKTVQNYGEEWSFNYELRWLGMHGSGGVGNSKARRQFLEREIFQNRKERATEEVGVRRACCEGGRRQIVPEDSRNV
jgi:hypothetical protein